MACSYIGSMPPCQGGGTGSTPVQAAVGEVTKVEEPGVGCLKYRSINPTLLLPCSFSPTAEATVSKAV